jgi:hypothetical protein
MTEQNAKRQLRRMLRSLTTGSLLHLLAELFRETAVQPRRRREEPDRDKVRDVASTLFVVGVGVDAVCPRLHENSL